MLDLKKQRNNVHDFVYLNKLERALLDTPEMQRLRYIKQLGFAYLVYETAEHSRFVHSTGVCHVAKLLMDCINRNHRILDEEEVADEPTKAKKIAVQMQIPYGSGQEAKMYEVFAHAAFPKVCWAQRFCVGLAALLHDVPHPPMSHALEHESAVMVKHDQVDLNPQLYLYLFGKSSSIAALLREYSSEFEKYLISQKNYLGTFFNFTEREIADYRSKNKLGENDVLAGLIFEILAFQSLEKHPFGSFDFVSSWEEAERGKVTTFYFSEFFQPFYADLISNTICADLMDYLMRDALNTGIQKQIELKFLDRMHIKKRPNAQSKDKARIVFDLTDRRGGLRKDAISDLLSLLESRYALMERTYMHRTKLAASAMLGRAFLLDEPSPETLYDLGQFPSDDAFLRHLLTSKSPAAIKLARKILERRIYKPLFIIDEEVCRREAVQLKKKELVKKFRPGPVTSAAGAAGWVGIRTEEQHLALAFSGEVNIQDVPEIDEYPFIIFCMEENVAYKDPCVLVEVPSHPKKSRPPRTRIEQIPDINGVLQLLRDFTSDHGAQSQISSMLTNYNTLWKLYVFADEDLVKQRPEAVPSVYVALVRAMGTKYPVEGFWRDLDLKDEDLDRAFSNDEALDAGFAPSLARIFKESVQSWDDKVKGLALTAREEKDLWCAMRLRLGIQLTRTKANAVVWNQDPELKRWVNQQIEKLAAQIVARRSLTK
jgi:HD superfamily phosphohydrolase